MRRSVELGRIQETALVPLYARALETRRKRPLLVDPKAVEIVSSIDWDFRRIAQPRRMAGCVLRGALFDVWVREFLQRHPDGTVVEIGAGLNTRFERLDNGRVHWFDLDLPDMIALRREFFADSDRRTQIAASVVDTEWITAVRRSPPPYLLVAETVLVYLEEAQVKAALEQIARGLPGATVALDTGARRAVDSVNRDHAKRGVAARFAWACEDPRAIQDWGVGLQLIESRTVADVPGSLWPRLSLPLRASLWFFGRFFPKAMNLYRLNLFVAR
jgi:O-methyltransferase involved in polyketide biosynthesis